MMEHLPTMEKVPGSMLGPHDKTYSEQHIPK